MDIILQNLVVTLAVGVIAVFMYLTEKKRRSEESQRMWRVFLSNGGWEETSGSDDAFLSDRFPPTGTTMAIYQGKRVQDGLHLACRIDIAEAAAQGAQTSVRSMQATLHVASRHQPGVGKEAEGDESSPVRNFPGAERDNGGWYASVPLETLRASAGLPAMMKRICNHPVWRDLSGSAESGL